MATCDDDQVLNMKKKRKRKIKPYGYQGKGINRGFYFGDQDTIESVITFRVGGCTIKRGS
jgi:hypothetical protein